MPDGPKERPKDEIQTAQRPQDRPPDDIKTEPRNEPDGPLPN